MMARVVCVHGIAQEYEAETTLLRAWAPALCGGVANAGGRLAEDEVGMAFYGALFRPAGTDKALGAEIPDYRAGDIDEGIEMELLAAWAGSVEGVGLAESPNVKGILDARTRGWMLQTVAQTPFFGDRSQRIVIWFLKQVRRYLTESAVRSQAQQAFRQALAADAQVVVAHSLGSVVAYDALRHDPHPRVRALITLGSPLGTPAVMRCLDPPASAPPAPWPGEVRRWFNIADSSDLVAMEKKLATWFGDRVSDALVHNGARMHDVSRYLTAKETGTAVMRALEV